MSTIAIKIEQILFWK